MLQRGGTPPRTSRTPRPGPRRLVPPRIKRRKLAALLLCLLVAGAAFAGWKVSRATDPALIDPIAVPNDIQLRTGDIIIAGGVSLQSRLVRSLADDNKYSHVGLIQATPHGVFVIHAAPSGEGDGRLGDQVAKIPLDLFLAERGYVTLRVMRLKAQSAQAKQAADDACDYALACAEQAVPFDGAFDHNNHDKIYCSELVTLAYHHAGQTWPDTLVTQVSTLLVDGPVVLPSAFADCEHLITVWNHENQPTANTKGKP